MNSLKNLLFLGILAVVAWGVYYSLNHQEAAGPPPPGAQLTEPTAPTVDIPSWPVSPAEAPAPGPRPQVSTGTVSAPAPAYAAVPTPPTPTPQPPPPSFTPPASTAPSFTPPAPPAPPPAAQATTSPAANLPAPPTFPASVPAGNSLADNRGVAEDYMAVLNKVHAKEDEGHLAEAHRLLSSLYRNTAVPPEAVRTVNEVLDQMAGAVIYSRQNLLEKPWTVQTGDTLKIIADAYNVPPQLLARINGVHEADGLRPGRELKVVRGPFSAVVSLKNYDLTLMLKDRYAGRFAIGIGDRSPQEGIYVVRDKQPADRPPQGIVDGCVPASKFWISLGSGIYIEACADLRQIHTTGGPGSILLSERDADDVCGILSIGSKVTIQR